MRHVWLNSATPVAGSSVDRDVLALADQLSVAQGISHIDSPAGLGLELRSYQKEGLAWLQFLREQKLSGILADDMESGQNSAGAGASAAGKGSRATGSSGTDRVAHVTCFQLEE